MRLSSGLDLVARFAAVANPALAALEPRASCIAQARITTEVFHRWGLPARPLPLALVVEVPALKYAYLNGLRGEQKAQARQSVANWLDRPTGDGVGFDGHVCTLVDEQWLIDTSLDQASAPDKGVVIEPCVLPFHLPPGVDLEHLHLEAKLQTESGLQLKLNYWPLDDHSFLRSEAWTDAGLLPLVDVIYEWMKSPPKEKP